MNNFKPGGIRHRRDDIGGRPRSDANYGPKNRFDKKPRHDDRGGDRGDRGGDRGGDRFDKGPRREVELFQTTCTTCGKSCEVPFRPDGTKPVLCKECFSQKNASPMGGNNFERRDRFESNDRPQRTERPQAPSVDLSGLTRQISALETKMNQVMEMLKSNNQQVVKTEAPKTAPAKEVEPATKAKTDPTSKVLVVGEKKAPAKKVVAPKAAPAKKVAAKKAPAKKVAAKKTK